MDSLLYNIGHWVEFLGLGFLALSLAFCFFMLLFGLPLAALCGVITGVFNLIRGRG